MTTQSPTLASQATAELPKPPPLPEPYTTLDGYTRPVFSATQMDNRWLRGYEAGRASRAQSEGEPLDVNDALRKLRFVNRVLNNFAGAPVSDRADAHQFVKEMIEAVWKSGRTATLGETK